YFNRFFTQFEKYYPVTGKNSISGKSISEFCEDDKKNIWIGTEDAGLNKFSPITGKFTKSPIASGNIHSLLCDEDRLWVGTFSDGLHVMNLQTQEMRSYKNGASDYSIKDDNIYSIYKDSSGRIWIGSLTGLQYYNEQSDNFRRIQEGIIKNQVNDILEDYKGTLWFATIGNGIFSYDRFSEAWQHYLSTTDMPDENTGKSIICLLQDKKNRLWIGTEGAGMGIFNRETNSFSSVITSNTGLPNDVIYKLIEDSKGYIWGSTNKGIFRLDPESMEVVTYTHSNGLLGDQFNYKSGFKDHNGKIYFGGVKGFVAFNPGDLGINEYIPPIVLTSFQIQNKEVSLNEEESPLIKSITQNNSFNIPYNASVSIGFAALSYVYPNGNMYAYKLEGRDNDWIYVNQAHQVNYADLSPGNYTFKVKGANSDGIWNEAGASLTITILPPWYKTVWAYLLYLVTTGAILYYSINNFVRKAKRRNARILKELENTKEKELYTAKIEFFTHITHEIRTPLSLIKIPLEDVINDIDRQSPYLENLTIIQRNVNRLLKLVNELMDFRKTESRVLRLNFSKTDVISIINETISRFRPSFESKKITFNTVHSIESLYADVDREVFTKIVSNLFSNALKHSHTVIELDVKYDEKCFEIKIENDGDTIPDEYVEKIFEPLFKLNKNLQGSGLGLAFVKSLVELHKGTIYCDNSKMDRTIFVMTLPIKQEQSINIHDEEGKFEKTESSQIALLESQKPSATPTILTVEDNEEFQQLLYKQLSKKYHVLQCKNGMEAINILDKENIDIVICDIMMPVMDGLEFCRTMKENIKYSHIPVILLTARTNLESKIEGINCGADEYIEKPYSTEYLLARIENLLENRRKMQEIFRNSPELAYQNITHSKADEDFLQKLIAIIHDNLDEPDLNIDMLAAETAVSRSTLYRKVKNVSELSPNDFIMLIRLKKAAELIKEKQYQISEIAYMVGFSSPNYFSKCFYKQFGVSPKDF
ncbi:MAG: two-component regulator propeller domain-containing protein, partial [Petrimonas sp.]|nr:two-component regulator propeller domain-containing protein [Petrimonas sp.]